VGGGIIRRELHRFFQIPLRVANFPSRKYAVPSFKRQTASFGASSIAFGAAELLSPTCDVPSANFPV